MNTLERQAAGLKCEVCQHTPCFWKVPCGRRAERIAERLKENGYEIETGVKLLELVVYQVGAADALDSKTVAAAESAVAAVAEMVATLEQLLSPDAADFYYSAIEINTHSSAFVDGNAWEKRARAAVAAFKGEPKS